LAQPYSAGSGKTEKRCVGNEGCQSAKSAHTSACTENACGQAATNIDVGEAIENTSRAEAAALREAVVRSALTETIAPIKTWNFQAVSRTEAQARLVRLWKAGRLVRWTGEAARLSTEA
jgi:hypothetical protein